MRIGGGVLTLVLALTLVGCSLGSRASTTDSSTTAGHSHGRPAATRFLRPPQAWLGVNYNSSSGLRLTQLSKLGIVYDRDGALETTAGQTAGATTALGRGLARSYAAGMVPDVLVDPARGPHGCTTNPATIKLCLPTSRADVDAYVSGFVTTVRSVIARFRGRRVLFEPMNEPWNWADPPGTEPGATAAREYARVLAAVLRASRRLGLNLGRYYVPANGPLNDGSDWIPDLYAAEPCLAPGPHTCGPIKAWNVHAYGVPDTTSEGIGEVPQLRSQMRSGRDNIIVSEIGYCASDVNRGQQCNFNQSDIDADSAQTAHWMRQTLSEALPMRRAGWLKALIFWARAQGGWAMQTTNGQFTDQGAVLARFAASRLGD